MLTARAWVHRAFDMVKIVIYVAQFQSAFAVITKGSFTPCMGSLQTNQMRLMLVVSIISIW